MPERNWGQPDASTQENRTEGVRSDVDALQSDVDALRAELGAFLYPVVSIAEAGSSEEAEEAEEGMDASILAGVL
jgi:hypothetical protein